MDSERSLSPSLRHFLSDKELHCITYVSRSLRQRYSLRSALPLSLALSCISSLIGFIFDTYLLGQQPFFVYPLALSLLILHFPAVSRFLQLLSLSLSHFITTSFTLPHSITTYSSSFYSDISYTSSLYHYFSSISSLYQCLSYISSLIYYFSYLSSLYQPLSHTSSLCQHFLDPLPLSLSL